MIGPHASWVLAQVINRETFGDRSDVQLVADAMRKVAPMSLTLCIGKDFQVTVSALDLVAGPLPTPVGMFLRVLRHSSKDAGGAFPHAHTLPDGFMG
jgi:hypothetical protein